MSRKTQLARIGIINVTGYVGAELARLIHTHPQVQLISVTGRSEVGKRVSDVFPHLADIDLMIEGDLGTADLVFSALPHKASSEVVSTLFGKDIKVIDLSADFRLRDETEYERWYDFTHPATQLLQKAVYGLPELHRREIESAQLIAVPGCYPTGAILALAPAVKEGIIHPDVIIDSKSGVSGAGRSLSLGTHYSEVNENIRAYALEGHRHFPEISQELGLLCAGSSLSLTFLPHLIPMTRGILSTCYAKLSEANIGSGDGGERGIRQLYQDFYKDEPFVKVVSDPPQTKQVWGSNFCFVYPTVDRRTDRLIVISCIDNLVKGAAGQAIQDMNLVLGFPETLGLEDLATYP